VIYANFLFQDISRYGEAPVREKLSGPDKERYTHEQSQNPPKTSSSSKSNHSHVHLPGHAHRHNKSNDDARSLRPTISREDSAVSSKTRAPTSMGTALGNSSNTSLQRSTSPTPSGMSNWSQVTARNAGSAGSDVPVSPTHNGKRHLLSLTRFRKHKEKDNPPPSRLKDLPGSQRSFGKSEKEKAQISPEFGQWSREGSIAGSDVSLVPRQVDNGQFGRSTGNPRQGTFNKNKLPFRKGRGKPEEVEHHSEHHERHDAAPGSFFNLDTNLSNMEGILSKPPPLTPLDNSIFAGNVEDEAKIEAESAGGLGWNAPDSWAVKKINDDNMSRLQEIDEGSYSRLLSFH
jgi:adenylate cyclase